MYFRDKVKTWILYLCALVAVGVCIALVVFFVNILRLRMDYRDTAMEINACVLTWEKDTSTVEWKGETYPLSEKCLDYYNQVLLGDKVMVARKTSFEPGKESIVLSFGGGQLSFPKAHPDGKSLYIRWAAQGKVKNYEVASGSITYMQLTSYMTNYIRGLQEP